MCHRHQIGGSSYCRLHSKGDDRWNPKDGKRPTPFGFELFSDKALETVQQLLLLRSAPAKRSSSEMTQGAPEENGDDDDKDNNNNNNNNNNKSRLPPRGVTPVFKRVRPGYFG